MGEPTHNDQRDMIYRIMSCPAIKLVGRLSKVALAQRLSGH